MVLIEYWLKNSKVFMLLLLIITVSTVVILRWKLDKNLKAVGAHMHMWMCIYSGRNFMNKNVRDCNNSSTVIFLLICHYVALCFFEYSY